MKTVRNPNISPAGKLKVHRDLDHWRAAERNIRAQPRTAKTGDKESTNYLWVQGMLSGLPLEIAWNWALSCSESIASTPGFCSGVTSALDYMKICASINHQLSLQNADASKREHGSSAGACGNTAGQAKRKSKGKLSKMEYLVLLQLIQTNSSKTSLFPLQAELSPTKFTSRSHRKLFPKTMPCPSWSQRD